MGFLKCFFSAVASKIGIFFSEDPSQSLGSWNWHCQEKIPKNPKENPPKIPKKIRIRVGKNGIFQWFFSAVTSKVGILFPWIIQIHLNPWDHGIGIPRKKSQKNPQEIPKKIGIWVGIMGFLKCFFLGNLIPYNPKESLGILGFDSFLHQEFLENFEILFLPMPVNF